eukprot:COSAG02_NODE_9987_length_2057_cov_1.283453_1_plen_61_part_00
MNVLLAKSTFSPLVQARAGEVFSQVRAPHRLKTDRFHTRRASSPYSLLQVVGNDCEAPQQ